MVQVRSVYLSAGCEARSHCLTSSKLSNRVIFASHSELVVADADRPSTCLISCSERRHRKPVTCIKRIHSSMNDNIELFVSGGSDGRINVWKLDNDNLHHLILLEGLTVSVAAVGGWMEKDTNGMRRIIVVGGAMGKLYLWKIIYHEDKVELIGNEILVDDFKSFILSVDIQRMLSEIHDDVYVIAAGTSKRSIDIYSGVIDFDENEINQMRLSLKLPAAHEDWVHSVEFDDDKEEPLLASCGQDTLIKLWRFKRRENEEIDDEVKRLEVKKMKMDIIKAKDSSIILSMNVHIDAVLAGHEDWVHSVHWHGPKDDRSLITASSDKSVVVWNRLDGGIWTDTCRLGVIGGQAAGFYGVILVGDGRTIVASSYYGGLHAWTKESHHIWSARSFGGGHCGSITDTVWSRGASYLLSTSHDKTTRVHTRLRQDKRNTVKSIDWSNGEWIEIGRAQIHGHEIQCITTLPNGYFVSGSEEKILRVFEMPRTVAESIRSICGDEIFNREEIVSLNDRVWGAQVPALGLSNTGKEKDDKNDENGNGDGYERHWEEEAFISTPSILYNAPTEECLQQNTLWPETHKLYGHGFELYALASNPTGDTVVSACRASQAKHASILKWTPPQYTEKASIIDGHSLTVTQCEFSPNGKWLLSVSRDRTAILYSKIEGEWKSVWQSQSKGGPHSRIIWSCSWLADSEHFVTVSREGTIVLWSLNGNEGRVLSIYSSSTSVTAVTTGLLPINTNTLSDNIIVIGMDNGIVQILSINQSSDGTVTLTKDQSIIDVPQGEENVDEHTITRLRFAPQFDESPLLLAVSTANKKLHVFEISQ